MAIDIFLPLLTTPFSNSADRIRTGVECNFRFVYGTPLSPCLDNVVPFWGSDHVGGNFRGGTISKN